MVLAGNKKAYFDYFIEDIAEEAERKFKDSDIIITVYNGSSRSNPSKIVGYEYDGRLKGSIQ